MSQPWRLKPKGWPGAGAPKECLSSQKVGSALTNRPGTSDRATAAAMRRAETQKMGRRRSCFHASPHMEAGALSSATASTAPSPCSSVWAT